MQRKVTAAKSHSPEDGRVHGRLDPKRHRGPPTCPQAGEEIFVVETEDGALLNPYDPQFQKAITAYGSGLIKNPPFIDGNNRIGFVTANMFLILNGHETEAHEPQCYWAVDADTVWMPFAFQ